ncbi:MAG: reverse transcriptase domain-containing protein [Desulfobacteraceae bacterium]|nr:reverse transcriptase domain-containing protein [Desulfobacteraceae bacterium]
MNFNNGNDNNKNNSKYVRAVRGGKYSLLSFRSVYEAYLDCRRRKRGTVNALRFEFDLLNRLTALALDLQKGTYQPSRSVCFIVRSPKFREIFASDFRDRIVHHLVVRELEKYWEPRFIFDSYACRKDKGIHAAVKRLQGFMLKATFSGKKTAYFLQLDIRSFFMSIDKYILFSIFQDSGVPDVMGDLLQRIIFHDCTQNYYFRGDRRMMAQIPPHKSLFKVGADKGLPIGNLTSQFFANVYLNELLHRLLCGLAGRGGRR